MLIELNVTPLTSGRHSGGGGTAAVVMDPASRGGPAMQLPEAQIEEELDLEAGVVPGSMEHQLQARLLVIDKRLRQAMYNSS